MGLRHYRDAKAVKYAADILMRMSRALEESSWPKCDDITRLQEDYTVEANKYYAETPYTEKE